MNRNPIEASRPRAPQPDSITIVEDTQQETLGEYRRAPGEHGRLVLRRSWFSKRLFFMAIFCLFWNGFLVNWYRNALSGGQSPGVMVVLFPLLHVAAGGWVTYYTLAGFLNKTWLTLAEGTLTVRHGPLPWPGNTTLATAEIEQIYCEEVKHQSKNGTSTSYSLSAMLRDGRKVTLLKKLSGADEALFLEQRIEERLRIPDEPVAGEFRG